jgi:hypothetical protein
LARLCSRRGRRPILRLSVAATLTDPRCGSDPD